MNSTTEQTNTRQIGQVKWFNNKAGYGFITVSDGENKGKDIFAHYSTISVGDTQYKYLVQGEYVEFDLITSTNESHEFQSVNITGIKGGQLMCETRQLNRPRTTYVPRDEQSRPPRQYTSTRDELPSRNDYKSRGESSDGYQQVQKKRQSSRSVKTTP